MTALFHLPQRESWRSARTSGARLASAGIHLALLGVALIPWSSPGLPPMRFNETTVVLYAPRQVHTQPLLLPHTGDGGGGGGQRRRAPASRGILPRAADKQLPPPSAEPPRNPDPALIVEPAIVEPQLALLKPIELLNIGDPNGIIGPPSSGTGGGGGIGDGHGRGDGRGDGPGAIDGQGGGCCDGNYGGRGGVTVPVIVYKVDPEYSEEARKARYEGTVILQALVRKDGGVDVLHIVRSLGFGLDETAVEALKRWRFRPATKNGAPVDFTLNVEVRFNIR